MNPVYDRRVDWFPEETPFESTMKGAPAKRPNIIFILADDLGWGDLSSYGSLHNETPNIDVLARGGIRFTHGYSGSSTCSPTRISLYTGRYPGRLFAGLQEPIVYRDDRTGIPLEHPTLPSIVKKAGYDTAMFGKWHVGYLPWFSPLRIGFDVFFGNLDGAMDYFSHIDTAGKPDLYEGETPVEQVGYYTEMISERASDYITNHTQENPFYLQVNYTSPHWPWEGPTDRATSEKITEAMKKDALTALFHFEGGSLETYRSMVASLDKGVGEVLDALDKRGIADDTIVIFGSDNGGERFAFMWPFVGEKGDLEEGGIRIPTIVRWPNAIDAGQVSDEPVVTMDWTATLIDVVGQEPDPKYPLDGDSLLPWLVDGAEPPKRLLRWRTQEQGAVRKGRFKLLFDRVAKPLWSTSFPKDGERVRLFDVTVDGREKADISGEYPDIVTELLADFHRFDAELLPYSMLTESAEAERLGRPD